MLNPGALICGANPGSPVTPDYPSPFRFTGTLHSVVVDVSGDLITDTESEMRMAMARQQLWGGAPPGRSGGAVVQQPRQLEVGQRRRQLPPAHAGRV